MDPKLFGPLVIVVVLTTIIAPIILKILFAKDKDNGEKGPRLEDKQPA